MRKEVEGCIVYEDNKIMVFLDIRPKNPGHTLVIPKTHWKNIYDIPEEELTYLYKAVKKFSVVIKRVLHAEGISIMQFNEKVAGQEVFHFHTHVIPRYNNDNMQLGWGSPKEASKEELEEIRKKIRMTMGNIKLL